MEMRKLIEATLVSLDGVVGSPQEWALPRWDDENKAYAQAALADVGAFLLGRVTYEMFAAAWSPITGDPYYDMISRLPKFVASASLAETTWNATLIKGDVAAEVARLKSEPGKAIMKYGTSGLDRTLTLTATKAFGNGIVALTYVPEYIPARRHTAAGHSA
jgi:dihydrofolate reductase